MKLSLYRWLPVFLVSVLLAGCHGLPMMQKTALTEAEYFAEGFDRYIETGDLQPLRRLPQEYPGGAWGERAELVVKLVEEQEELLADQQKMAEAKAGEGAKQVLLKDKQIARCNNELAVLRQNNQDLEETIARLKKLLIEMESRSN